MYIYFFISLQINEIGRGAKYNQTPSTIVNHSILVKLGALH